jgi:outer membrane protein assembly factor BamB
MKSIVVPAHRGMLALILLSGLALGACARHGKTQQADAQPAKSAAAAAPKVDFPLNHDAWSALGYRLDWIGFPFKSGFREPIVSAVALDSCFVIQSKSSETACLDGLTGERRWGTGLANPLTKFVGIARDTVDPSRILVSSESEGYLLAEATGSLVAKTRYEKVVNTAPVLSGRQAIFGTSTGEVTGHLISQNVKAWGFQTTGSIEATPVLMDNGEIGTVAQSGDVYFLNTGGQVMGRNRILSSVAMNPATDGSSLYIGGLDQSIWAFSSSGALLWRHRTAAPLTTQIAVRNGVVYCTVPSEGLIALEATSGKVLWTARETFGEAIAFRNGRLLVRTDKGVDALDPVTGSRTQSIALPGIVRLVVEKFDDGVIFAVAANGNVAKFIPKQ